jgi:hypothetical protein
MNMLVLVHDVQQQITDEDADQTRPLEGNATKDAYTGRRYCPCHLACLALPWKG